MVEPEGINLKPEPVLCNSRQEMGTGVCEESIGKTSIAIGLKTKKKNKIWEGSYAMSKKMSHLSSRILFCLSIPNVPTQNSQ